jgi:hypothetical protein
VIVIQTTFHVFLLQMITIAQISKLLYVLLVKMSMALIAMAMASVASRTGEPELSARTFQLRAVSRYRADPQRQANAPTREAVGG